MRVAVIDIGSNTARLLVADVCNGDLVDVDRARAYLRLGAEIERRGTIRRRKIEETASVTAEFAARARRLGAERAELVVTAPGRQTCEPERLTAALREATGWNTRILGHREEGSLAFDGAIARTPIDLPETVAVVDVGGGSTEISVGTPTLGADWVHSLDVGSLRLTRRLLPDDPPGRKQVARARAVIARSLREVEAPSPDVVLAVGGTARALRGALGRRYDADALERVVNASTGRTATATGVALGLDDRRAATVTGGAILLAAVARMFGRELAVATGGLREGLALELAEMPALAGRAA